MNRAQLAEIARTLLKVFGATGTLLTVLFAIRAGYLHSRETLDSQHRVKVLQAVAEQQMDMVSSNVLDRLGALDVAVYALDEALKLAQEDRELECKDFEAVAEMAYDDMDTRPFAYEYWEDDLPEISASGWQCLQQDFSPEAESRLRVALARLEAWNPTPQRIDTVEKLLREAGSIDPDNPEAVFQLALILLEKDEDDTEASEMLNSLVDANPDNPRYLVELGSLMLDRSEVPEAVALLQQAIALEGKTEHWEDVRAINRAKSLLNDELIRALSVGEDLPPGIDKQLADRLMDGYFLMLWSVKGVAGAYWWREGDFAKAIRYLVESDTDYRSSDMSVIARKELEVFGMREDDIFPALTAIKASLSKVREREYMSDLVADIDAYVASVEERALFEVEITDDRRIYPGIEVQYWPKLDAPLLIRRVVPGSVLAQAGLRPGDRLQEVDGKPVRTIDELIDVLVDALEESSVHLSIVRDGKTVRSPAPLTG